MERQASAETLEEAEIEATLADNRERVAAGRPGAVSHEEAMAELHPRLTTAILVSDPTDTDR